MYQNLTQRLWNQIPAQFFPSQKTSHKLCAELFSVHPTGTQMSAIPDGQRMIPTRSLLIVKKKLFTQRVKTWHRAPVKKIQQVQKTPCCPFTTSTYIIARSNIFHAHATSNSAEVAVFSRNRGSNSYHTASTAQKKKRQRNNIQEILLNHIAYSLCCSRPESK